MKRVAVCVTLTLLVACGEQKPGRGTIHAVVSTGLVSTTGITRVTITVAPAGVTKDLAYNAADGTFTGTLTGVATGAQTVTAIAYTGSAPNETEVGRGSASVTIVTGASASVDITIYDTTGPPPPPDHGPVILTFVVQDTKPMSGTMQTLTATAMDADGQSITFAWTQVPANCGAFSNASAASTQWTAGPGGPCTVTITATANGKSDARLETIQIVATGSLDVTGRYVPQPIITHVAVLNGATVWWDVARGAADATSPTSLATGASYEVRAYYAPAPGAVVALDDSCLGAIGGPATGTDGSGTYAAFTWTAPTSATACILTPKLTVPGPAGNFHDAFPIVVRVGL